MKYPLIVFDWDGTLMDSTGRIVSAMQRSARNVGLDVPSAEAVRSIIGLSLTRCYDLLFPGVGGDDLERLTREYRFQYIEGDPTPTPLFGNSLAVLEDLKTQGYQLAVATGKARAGLDRVMSASGTGHLFDDSCCADEAESKPHPEMLEKICQRLRRHPREALMIGDTTFDLEMAANAKMGSLGVSYGAHGREQLVACNPLSILDDIGDLPRWLDQPLVA